MAKYTVFTKYELTGRTSEAKASNMDDVRRLVASALGGGIAAERFVKKHMIIGCEVTVAHVTVVYRLTEGK